uniref:SANT domain-containing protein n=1 Tax=Spongospora subterranea TaxID=70186 RepID=A0A0H5R779_9EUKA|eukprot:CRZ09968.1 hypothetical protein [Spongospora subterranea]
MKTTGSLDSNPSVAESEDTSSKSPQTRVLDVFPDDIISFVQSIAREPTRTLSAQELKLAELAIAIRKKWSSPLFTEPAPAIAGVLRRRRAVPATEEAPQPKKRRVLSRSSPGPDETAEPTYDKPVLTLLPQRRKVDMFLNSMSAIFHQPDKKGVPPEMVHYVMPDKDRIQYSTLDALLSPLRKQSIWETWSPFQIALFEAGICTLGKNFHDIAKLIDQKTTGDVVNLYYHWKQSSHYEMWKSMGKPIALDAAPSELMKDMVNMPSWSSEQLIKD